MNLQDKDGKILISKEEFEFLKEAKKYLPFLRNAFFKEGRNLDRLVKRAEKLNAPNT